MGCCGGSEVQESAARDPIVHDTRQPDVVRAPCESSTRLVVVVTRADTRAGVEGVLIKVKGPKELEKASAKDTGQADFGEVDPGDYEILVALDQQGLKKFKQRAATKVNVADAATQNVPISLEPIFLLRLILFDADDKPIGGRRWKLTAPSAKEGSTGADGLIEVEVGHADARAALEVNLRDERAAPPPGAAAPAPPPSYPSAIVPADFKDKDPKPVLPPMEANDVKWSLSILAPEQMDMDSDDALRARLHNLGFSVDAGGSADQTRLAVQAYQRHYENNRDGTGALADIEESLKKRHDNPPG